MNPKRPTILAIDDNPQNLVTLATSLEADFDFQLASSGLQGLALAEATPPDLILLDVMMPVVDGFETCRRLKVNPKLASIPIIFLTALSDLETEVSGLALGAADYITKPINVSLVRQRVRNLLQLTSLARELKSSEERLRLVMDATGEGIWDWQVQSGTIVHNAAWPLMLGLDETLLTHLVDDFINRIHPQDLPAVQQAIQSSLDGADYVSEHRLRFKDSHYIWVLDRGKVVERSADGTPLRMVGSMKNIDERKRSEAEIHRLAFYDALTSLPNRRLLIERLQLTITKKRRSQELGALMFLDMDRFKLLNDTHGHAMGDALLIQVANRLQACLRAGDTVARLGGDEFVVLLDELTAEPDVALQKALEVASKILGALNQPYQLGSLIYPSTPSIGVTLFSGLDVTMDDVLKRADSAMYAAKAAGRNTIRVFDASQPEEQVLPVASVTLL